jgi:DNA-binding transcriptional ArsR family regulator
VPTQEMRALFHPTRARILELLRAGPSARTSLTESAGAPLPAVAYHCRTLLRSRCIRFAPTYNADSEDPVFETRT